MSSTQPHVVEHPNPNLAWLNKLREEILDPDLPIVDPHHHLWDRSGSRYYLDELLADLNSGHNIVATVFLQCFWSYRTEGPEEMRPVGETEFVASVAAEAERRKTRQRVCAAIVGHVDFRAGEHVDAVLEAHMAASNGRFRGIRQVAARVPLDRMLIETDAPFLAPLPYRGKRNESAYVVEVARTIASVRNLQPEEVASATAANFRRFFRLAAPSDPTGTSAAAN